MSACLLALADMYALLLHGGKHGWFSHAESSNVHLVEPLSVCLCTHAADARIFWVDPELTVSVNMFESRVRCHLQRLNLTNA